MVLAFDINQCAWKHDCGGKTGVHFFYISILPEIDDGIKEIGICDIFHFQYGKVSNFFHYR